MGLGQFEGEEMSCERWSKYTYETVAQILLRHREDMSQESYQLLCETFATEFTLDNPRFRPSLFLARCEAYSNSNKVGDN